MSTARLSDGAGRYWFVLKDRQDANEIPWTDEASIEVITLNPRIENIHGVAKASHESSPDTDVA